MHSLRTIWRWWPLVIVTWVGVLVRLLWTPHKISFPRWKWFVWPISQMMECCLVVRRYIHQNIQGLVDLTSLGWFEHLASNLLRWNFHKASLASYCLSLKFIFPFHYRHECKGINKSPFDYSHDECKEVNKILFFFLFFSGDYLHLYEWLHFQVRHTLQIERCAPLSFFKKCSDKRGDT